MTVVGAVALTAVVYVAVERLGIRLGRPPLANAVLWSTIAVLAVVALAGVDVGDYADDAWPLRELLAPATVALAVPLARQVDGLRRGGWRVLLAVVVGGVAASVSALAVTVVAGAPTAVQQALATKSVTTPIALAIVDDIEIDDGLVAGLVVVAGVYGAIVGPSLARRVRDDDRAVGLGVGVAAHAIGTAELAQREPSAAGYAAAGLVLNGVLTSLWLPPLLDVL